MKNIIIREATINDLDFLVDSMVKMAKETENLVLSPSILEPGIKSGLMDKLKANYFIAEINNQRAGTLMITKEWSDWRNAWVLWIQSVYTSESFRKLGVYKALYNHIKKLVIANPDFCGIRLYVDKTNKPAQNVYTTLGMNGEHYQMFEWML
jgi:ribosomal protein S18 acetylase RimI-like enzyme